MRNFLPGIGVVVCVPGKGLASTALQKRRIDNAISILKVEIGVIMEGYYENEQSEAFDGDLLSLYMTMFDTRSCSASTMIYVRATYPETCLQRCFDIGMRCWNRAQTAVWHSLTLLIVAAKSFGSMSQLR